MHNENTVRYSWTQHLCGRHAACRCRHCCIAPDNVLLCTLQNSPKSQMPHRASNSVVRPANHCSHHRPFCRTISCERPFSAVTVHLFCALRSLVPPSVWVIQSSFSTSIPCVSTFPRCVFAYSTTLLPCLRAISRMAIPQGRVKPPVCSVSRTSLVQTSSHSPRCSSSSWPSFWRHPRHHCHPRSCPGTSCHLSPRRALGRRSP